MRRISGEPYILHPIAVAKIASNEIGLGVKSIICALLHDIVEDTDITIQDLIRTAADFALIAYENGADMARQNIRYRELTVTPYTHTDYQDKGITIENILQGLEEGRQRAKQEFGVEMRWVFDVPRNLSFVGENGRYGPNLAKLSGNATC